MRKVIVEPRKDLLLEPRWPEMVTYEEMNLQPPKGQEILRIALRFMDSEARKRKLLSLRAPAVQPIAASDTSNNGMLMS